MGTKPTYEELEQCVKDVDALRKSEGQLRLFIEHTPAAVAICDLDMKYLAYSRRWKIDYNLPDENLIGCCHYDVFRTIPQKWKEEHQRCFSGEIIDNQEEQFLRADGSLDWVKRKVYPWRDLTGKIGGLIMFTEVITKQKQLQARLLQAHKMEAIGTLAGGIAHDFNNLMMGIQGRVSLALADCSRSDINYDHLNGIEEYVKSATDLTKQLLGFARGGKYEVKSIDMNKLMENSAKLFGRAKKEIEIHRKYQDDLWTVAVDQRQIEQVMLNIYVNAWQAMPAGGKLYLKTENVILDENFIQPFQVAHGRYVRISITDTGVGMDEATRKKIFDPFFTTKDIGKGAGLGLASAYGIIKNHNGIINVYSEKGKGTSFSIYLPAASKMASKEKKKAINIMTGKETVLLVDDEEIVKNVCKEMLEALGYSVYVAESGERAIEIYKEYMQEIQIVVLDMIMPGMDGGMTYDHLKKIDPNVTVLLSSGYSINGEASEILHRGCNGFIQKPFNLTKLSETMRRILDEKSKPVPMDAPGEAE